MGWLRHLLGDRVPADFDGSLDDGEHVVGSAAVEGGGYLLVTPLGLWIPGPRRVGWHLVGKAAWSSGVLTLTESEETGMAGDAVLLADKTPVRFELARPGKVPILVRQRVDGSVRGRYRKDLGTGGAWFVERKVPGQDGTVLQVRPDPGTDVDLVKAIAEEAARKLAKPDS
ncbi:hypothetical protein [Amycolatopsis keratiniphila]|uniref:hypothetical protein n=1 Tax=Amycolatopsis keratiniphila TaxID=129921 RepID=UPI00087AD3C0|nr:hypothetical protein [Amycolatopsis keratiniphila]OLZ46819.1 hypothetical protein BS330_37330 [Amycolatopsis keratiniphila subsp. nogabecina]SDU39414.1 hypothetical protein SAMN04489733_3719 [Amycolatopsis keratiniphila]